MLFYSGLNNWFIRQRALIKIWSTWEVWRARKMRKSCSTSFLGTLQTSQVLHISMNTQLTYEPIVLQHFPPDGKIFSQGICLLTWWVCTIGIWSMLTQLNLVTDKFTRYVINSIWDCYICDTKLIIKNKRLCYIKLTNIISYCKTNLTIEKHSLCHCSCPGYFKWCLIKAHFWQYNLCVWKTKIPITSCTW